MRTHSHTQTCVRPHTHTRTHTHTHAHTHHTHQAAEAKGDTPAQGLEEEDAFMFVVFDGGDQSVAEIKLKRGLSLSRSLPPHTHNGAAWSTMKSAM
jgi:hypothetical protein